MFVNSVKFLNPASFKGQENENVQQIDTQPQPAQSESAKVLPEANSKPDTFEHKTQSEQPAAPQNLNQQAFKLPTIQQITKMQTTQKVLGGSAVAVGALGILSSLSKKKLVRMLFTVPVGAAIAGAGALMIYSANSYNKIKDVLASQPKQ